MGRVIIMSTILAYAKDFISMEKVEINHIPCLKFKPREAKELLPTVLYYHGWGSNKENQTFKASIIACNGYQVIVPDSIYHGERNHIDHNATGIMEKYFWEVVLNSVEESKHLIGEIIRYHEADSNRIGIMGHSMGGFISSGAFCINKKIKCMINYNGSCAWVRADEIFRKMYNQQPANEKEISRLRKYDLIKHHEVLKLRPILILHGAADTSVPIDSQRIFYKEISSLYKEKPEKLTFIEYPRLDHYMGVGMLEEGILWFKRYL